MSAKKKGASTSRAVGRSGKGDTVALQRAQDPLVDPAPLGIPRWGWVLLTLVDAFLFVVGIAFARVDISLAACALAFCIEKFAHRTLVGKYEARQEELRSRAPQLTKEQRREVIEDFRASRKAARQGRREGRGA